MHLKRGFTLIEILIVLVIISIVAGVAVMSLHTNERKQIEMFADRLVNLLNLATEEAMLRPATLGFKLTPDAYQFYTYQHDDKKQKEGWQAISYGLLSRHTLTNHIQLTMTMQGEPVPNQGQPQLIIPPSGDTSPFVILIYTKNNKPLYQIKAQENGDIIREDFQAK